MKFKYKIGDIIKLKPNATGFSWHNNNPKKSFCARIEGFSETLYILYIFEIYSKEGKWAYDESSISRLATEDERRELFLEEI